MIHRSESHRTSPSSLQPLGLVAADVAPPCTQQDLNLMMRRHRWQIAALKFQRALVLHEAMLQKANFNPNQPRVPAGQREGGQWTGTGASSGTTAKPRFTALNSPNSGGIVLSDALPDPIIAGARYAAANTPVRIDFSRALTGISNIDETTRTLAGTLARTMETMDFIPDWTPRAYGTAVHVAFGTMVRFQGIPGIGHNDVEHTFGDSPDPVYGEKGSIRTDVVLRNASGQIIAIYDVKTGSAGLSAARVRKLRLKTKTGPSVPIIELHVIRGAILKGRMSPPRLIGHVVAQLSDPRLDIQDPAAIR